MEARTDKPSNQLEVAQIADQIAELADTHSRERDFGPSPSTPSRGELRDYLTVVFGDDWEIAFMVVMATHETATGDRYE